jgi:carbon monoxide dehydrogenase subunit G
MLEFENTITVNRPIGEVFKFVADPENFPRWNYYVLSVSKLSNGPVGVGTVYHQIRKTDQQDFRITEFERDRRMALKTSPHSTPQLEMRLTFHEQDGATRLRDTWVLDTGLPGPLEWLGARRVRAAVGENLAKLKQLLEEGRTILQDGRITSF